MIRLALADDADVLGHLHVRSWQVGYKNDFDSDFLDELDVPARIKWFRRVIGMDTPVIVADVDGDPVGFAMVGAARAGESEWGEVFSIYVHPDFWGEGHGFELLAAAEQQLSEDGFEQGLLWVLDRNHRARRFYERQGWLLSHQIKLEQIGDVQVNEVRYEKDLRGRV